MYDETVTIVENHRVNGEYFKISFRSKNLSHRVRPGQFLHVQLGDQRDPFLRRPFSYYRIKGSKIEVLYEVLGRGTQLLAQMEKGQRLKVMGPLGREFSEKIGSRKRILVGGGVGVPPLVFLAERNRCHRFFIGTRTKKQVLPNQEIQRFRPQIFYSTEDGSFGTKGFVTQLLENFLQKENANPNDYFIQTCGPNGMMERVMEIAAHYKIPGEASWDERMACGLGVCLGCMVHTHQGWTPSCTEGPVFRFDEIVHNVEVGPCARPGLGQPRGVSSTIVHCHG